MSLRPGDLMAIVTTERIQARTGRAWSVGWLPYTQCFIAFRHGGGSVIETPVPAHLLALIREADPTQPRDLWRALRPSPAPAPHTPVSAQAPRVRHSEWPRERLPARPST
ncbi:hypothetical protein ACFV1N_46195, partial [Streptosporangium canum]|uniref:hypothetical protein n=1 Tax=Streptosporangium canum TaxID=324952 RepID=UPI0036AC8073